MTQQRKCYWAYSLCKSVIYHYHPMINDESAIPSFHFRMLSHGSGYHKCCFLASSSSTKSLELPIATILLFLLWVHVEAAQLPVRELDQIPLRVYAADWIRSPSEMLRPPWLHQSYIHLRIIITCSAREFRLISEGLLRKC